MGSSITIDGDRRDRIMTVVEWSNRRRPRQSIRASWVDAIIDICIPTEDLSATLDRAWREPTQIYSPALLLLRLQDIESARFKGITTGYRPRGAIRVGQFSPLSVGA